MSRPRILVAKTKLYKPIEEVFTFFSTAKNLREVTPPNLQFDILTPLPIEMQKGTLIDYRIQLSGIPMRWQTLISAWEPPYRFVDEQLRGPYSLWRHEHTFEDKGDYVLMTDTVEYLSPGWVLEPIVHHLFVKHQVEGIFAFREKRFKELFPAPTSGVKG